MALDKKEREELTERIIDALHSVYDPEIPVDVYELGLIYDVTVSEDGDVHILMTMTTPNCPMIESLPEEIKEKVAALTGVKEVDIEITFEPAWVLCRKRQAMSKKSGTLRVPLFFELAYSFLFDVEKESICVVIPTANDRRIICAHHIPSNTINIHNPIVRHTIVMLYTLTFKGIDLSILN